MTSYHDHSAIARALRRYLALSRTKQQCVGRGRTAVVTCPGVTGSRGSVRSTAGRQQVGRRRRSPVPPDRRMLVARRRRHPGGVLRDVPLVQVGLLETGGERGHRRGG